MKKLLKFLKTQKLLTIASRGAKDIWIANVYFAADENGTLYFISPKDTKHSTMIRKNSKIAFSIAWFDPKNHKNRKAVQGLGTCRTAKTPLEIATGIKLLYKNFPDLRRILTVKWIMTNAWGTKVWVVKPSYIKYWDDEVYGDDESEEFTFK
ncbi:MAG: hypothetical protein A3B90_01280 [Candidatus Magasanikbacteria bacterium RIFCSPHIGHO2_02_FULL_41_13]|uniref:Uncharacterized protein n=1 Tax=Candidatus Magasanikbacteria bacterium RIFCSPHIGHO2_02_FULL_41_13 TaxID=1798676 RepID=A0A1F6M435_9BACT|nr:MAG: hypothetical protein A3B90_01280 [Candidatus Magasanikbacteria bacterium RIFCSPHIGHO2_02_FULL_41_13]